MATIVIRDVEDRLLSDISDLAKANRLSVEAQITLLLERTVRAASQGKRSADVARAIADLTPAGVTQTDSTTIV